MSEMQTVTTGCVGWWWELSMIEGPKVGGHIEWARLKHRVLRKTFKRIVMHPSQTSLICTLTYPNLIQLQLKTNFIWLAVLEHGTSDPMSTHNNTLTTNCHQVTIRPPSQSSEELGFDLQVMAMSGANIWFCRYIGTKHVEHGNLGNYRL